MQIPQLGILIGFNCHIPTVSKLKVTGGIVVGDQQNRLAKQPQNGQCRNLSSSMNQLTLRPSFNDHCFIGNRGFQLRERSCMQRYSRPFSKCHKQSRFHFISETALYFAIVNTFSMFDLYFAFIRVFFSKLSFVEIQEQRVIFIPD